MAKTAKKRASSSKRYVWRDDAGRYHGIIVADPPVRPKTTPVYKIRQAVKKAASGSRAGRKSK